MLSTGKQKLIVFVSKNVVLAKKSWKCRQSCKYRDFRAGQWHQCSDMAFLTWRFFLLFVPWAIDTDRRETGKGIVSNQLCLAVNFTLISPMLIMCRQGAFHSTSGLVQNYIVHICLVAVTMLGMNSALSFPFLWLMRMAVWLLVGKSRLTNLEELPLKKLISNGKGDPCDTTYLLLSRILDNAPFWNFYGK